MTDLVIQQGKTLTRVVRWSSLPYIYKAITAITKAAPVSITAAAHGLVDGWPAAVVSAQGMRQINAMHSPPRISEFRRTTYVDADTVTLNGVNSAGYDAYTSGGYLQYYTPASLVGCTARLTIRDTAGGTALLALDSALLGGIALDDTAKTITVTVSATNTAAFTWTEGVYELEIETASGVVTQLLYGLAHVSPPEIAT